MASSRRAEPVNLLSLDGGGVRGVSELVILDEIMKEIQRQENLDELPKPCDYFDLVSGTSTGGLIAIMLGRLNMNTQEALAEYDTVAGSIFGLSNLKFGLLERYKSKAVKHAVEDLVKRRNLGHKMHPTENTMSRSKTFVCAMPASGDGLPHLFKSFGDTAKDSTPIWEAARATTAAPLFFKRMTIDHESKDPSLAEDFIDGAIRCNNPSRLLLQQANVAFDKRRRLNCLVSVGTGTKGDNNLASSQGLQKIKWVGGIIRMMKERLTECEEIHRQMLETFEDWPDTYFRFNVPDGARYIGLSSHKKMELLKDMTREYLDEPDTKKAIQNLVKTIRTKPNKGLTVGHAYRPMKDQLLLETRVAVPRGHASKIFTGRQNILGQLNAVFEERKDAKIRREFLLCGMGGVGKTQIALKFVEMNENRFKSIVWIDATDRLATEQSYKDIATRIFPNWKGDSEALNKVKAWLENLAEDWLLVMDNISDEDMSDYIPDGDRGNILYTSRHQDPMSVNSIPSAVIDDMDEEDSITLLLRAAKEIPYAPRLRELGKPIVKDLGYLPLAIDQAGAFICMSKMPMEKYRKQFLRHRKRMLQDTRFKGASPRNQAVYATFEMSYTALLADTKLPANESRSKEAVCALQVLNMICFYYNENVPREIVQRTAKTRHRLCRKSEFPLMQGAVSLEGLVTVDESGEWDSENFDLGADLLDRFSLVKRDDYGSYISMHILVHAWVRDRMTDTDFTSKGFCARTMIIESIPQYFDTESHAYRRKIIPHIITCQGYVNAKHDHEILESEYDGLLAVVAAEAGMFDIAEKHLISAIEARKLEYGLNGGPTLRAMSDLARVYYSKGQYWDAKRVIDETLERREESFSPTHFRTLRDREFLAQVHGRLWDLEKAEEILADVVAIREEQCRQDGKETWALVSAKSRLASIRDVLHGTHQTVQEAEETVAAAIRFHGVKSLAALSAEARLAGALAHEGRREEAKALIYMVRDDYEKVSGPMDVATLNASSVLAGFWLGEGNSIAAEELWRDVLEKCKATLGREHPMTIFTLSHLSIAILMQGRIEIAIPLLESGVEYLDNRLGADHMVVTTQRRVIEELRGYEPHVGPEIRERLRGRAEDVARRVLGNLPRVDDINNYLSSTRPEWEYAQPSN